MISAPWTETGPGYSGDFQPAARGPDGCVSGVLLQSPWKLWSQHKQWNFNVTWYTEDHSGNFIPGKLNVFSWATFNTQGLASHAVKVLLLFKSLGMVALKAQKTHANRQNTIKLRKLIFTNLTRPRNTAVCEIVTNLILYGFVYMGTNPIDYILWQIDKLQWYSVIEQYMQQEHVQSCCRFCDSWRSCCQRSVSGFGKWSKMFM